MTMSTITSLVLLTLTCAVSARDPVITVDELDVPSYLGRWFQVAASPIVYETFEKNAVCVTADYGVYNATTLTVYNANRMFTPTGELNEISGYAYTTKEPGQLSVDLAGAGTGAPYWVYKLGPIEKGQYQYSVVTDPFRAFLFVLARDVNEYYARFDKEVSIFLKENGFNTLLNRPIKTVHDKTCLYATPPATAELFTNLLETPELFTNLLETPELFTNLLETSELF